MKMVGTWVINSEIIEIQRWRRFVNQQIIFFFPKTSAMLIDLN